MTLYDEVLRFFELAPTDESVPKNEDTGDLMPVDVFMQLNGERICCEE